MIVNCRNIIGLVFMSIALSFVQPHHLVAQSRLSYDAIIQNLNDAREASDFSGLARSYFHLALFEERIRKNSERSFDYLSRSLDYYKVVKDSSGIQNIRYHIARQMIENAMFEDAYDELVQLAGYYKRSGDAKRSAEIELQLFKIDFENLDVKAAVESLDKAGAYIDQIDNPELEINYLIEKIRYFDLVQDLDTAMVLANICIEKSHHLNSTINKALCLAARGNINFQNSEFLKAILDFEESLSLLYSIPYNKDRLGVYNKLAAAYNSLSDFGNAYRYVKLYSSLQDSILNENRIIAVSTITNKFETRQKSTEIKLKELEIEFAHESNQQQKRALIVLIIALGGLLLGIYYIVRFYKEKIETARIIEKQNDEINRQKINELQDKIQINSMQSMINGQEIERERIAKDLHDSLGGLLSTIKLKVDNLDLDSTGKMDDERKSTTDLIDVAVSEVRSISQNLQPGALSRLGLIPAINDLVNRYEIEGGPEITFQHFDIPTKMDQQVALGIYRIVQEILNNAIKHARASEILVQLNMEHDNIVIHVEDDGVGFDTSESYAGMGMGNIKSRVNYLKGSMEIDSRKDQGTSYLIHVKSFIRQSI